MFSGLLFQIPLGVFEVARDFVVLLPEVVELLLSLPQVFFVMGLVALSSFIHNVSIIIVSAPLSSVVGDIAPSRHEDVAHLTVSSRLFLLWKL